MFSNKGLIRKSNKGLFSLNLFSSHCFNKGQSKYTKTKRFDESPPTMKLVK